MKLGESPEESLLDLSAAMTVPLAMSLGQGVPMTIVVMVGEERYATFSGEPFVQDLASLAARAKRDRRTISRLNRRAQTAERLVGVAMRAGLDRIERLRGVHECALAKIRYLETERREVLATARSLPYKIASFFVKGGVRGRCRSS